MLQNLAERCIQSLNQLNYLNSTGKSTFGREFSLLDLKLDVTKMDGEDGISGHAQCNQDTPQMKKIACEYVHKLELADCLEDSIESGEK